MSSLSSPSTPGTPPGASPDTEPAPADGIAAGAGRGPQRDVTWPAVSAIAWREVVRFFRQRNRVIGAVMTPVVFWVLLGLGLNETFRVNPGGVLGGGDMPTEVGTPGGGELGYLEFFFPGMVVLMVLFTAIFSTISVIEDRKEGFLQGVLASPAKRWAIVLGKVLGGAGIATAQGVVLLAIWCVFFEWPGVVNLVAATAVMFVVAVGLTGLGLCIAWPMDSTTGFHAVMNLLLMPMWFLCGAVFPVGTAGLMKWVMYANPLTYGNAAFSQALMGDRAVGIGMPGWVVVVLMLAGTFAAVAGATRLASRKGKA